MAADKREQMMALPRVTPLSTGLVLAGLSLLLAACGTTYGTGTSAGAQTVRDLTGMVAVRGSDEEIQYQARPPVVAPPVAGALPPPGSAQQVANAPDWPKDPDAEAYRFRQTVAAREAARRRDGSDRQDVPDDPGFRLPEGATPVATRPNDSTPMTAEEEERLRKAFAAARGHGLDAQGRPVRRYLTDPPAEYHQPDPTVPVEVAEDCEPRGIRWPWQSRTPDGCS